MMGLDSTTTLMLGSFAVIVVLAAAWQLQARFGARSQQVYTSKRLLNASEGKLYVTLERWRRENARDLNLSTQVSYGAFIGAKERDDWRKVAVKHADFVFWGRDGYVRAIVEFDGSGHYGDSREAAQKVQARDEIKNAAAISANIPLIRIPQGTSQKDLEETLAAVLLPAKGPKIVTDAADNVAHLKV